ncbi:MAG: 4Fe-4S binding protein [Chloroflexales bacterium]|nr:4Fe-4S binding protein [Chloroflexales bacterium]
MSTATAPPFGGNQHIITNRRWERRLGVVAIITIVIAWIVGGMLGEADREPHLRVVMPQAAAFERLTDTIYAAYDSESPNAARLGYVGFGAADGYGGPLTVAVAVAPDGTVLHTSLVAQRETPSFIARVVSSDLLESLTGRSYADPITLGADVDAVTGAPLSSRAIVDSVRQSVLDIAETQLGYPIPPPAQPTIMIGPKELVLVALFALGYIAHQRRFRYTSHLRWATLLLGLVTIGFMYNSSLTITAVNQLLLGFWPDWHTNLYWYILVGGAVAVFAITNKNPYCQWFCPFGAAQECLAVIGGAKVRTPRRYRWGLKWLQRGLAWLAIVLALLLRNPGVTSFEIFGTLFTFVGSPVQFALLGMILIGALYWKRPWCNYLCPIDPIMDFMRMFRTWGIELWQTHHTKKPAAAP